MKKNQIFGKVVSGAEIVLEVNQTAIDSLATPAEKNFNGLSPAQIERLVLLQEELAESIQAVSKILRHGYESYNPARVSASNRLHLQEELGHVQNSISMLVTAGDLQRPDIDAQQIIKARTVRHYLHHN